MTRTTLRNRVLTAALASALLVGGSLAGAAPAMAAAGDPPLDTSGVTVTISGTPKVGQTLTVTTSGWHPDAVLSYQWSFNGGNYGGPIDGETGTSYTVTSDLIGLWVGVSVIGQVDGFEDGWESAGLADVVFTDQAAPAAAPVADSSGLAAYLAGRGPDATSHTPADAGLPSGELDPTKGYTATILVGAGDSYVDVFAYSAPVRIGTFAVVGGQVQVPLTASTLAALGAGTHTLVTLGQSSGKVNSVQFSIASTLAATGVSTDAVPFALAGVALVLGGVLLVVRRRKDVAA